MSRSASSWTAPNGWTPALGGWPRSQLASHSTQGRDLLERCERDSKILYDARVQLTAAAAAREVLSGEAEWLLDNFHIINEALREVRTDLPPGYYGKLPKLADGPLAGWPRVYWLALELIARTDSALEEATLTRFIAAYQEVTPLTIGELWAVPIMLRQVLVENLSRLAEGIIAGRADQAEAHMRVQRVLSAADLPAAVSSLVNEVAGTDSATPQVSANRNVADSVPASRRSVAVLQALRGGTVPRARLEPIEAAFRERGLPVDTWLRDERQRRSRQPGDGQQLRHQSAAPLLGRLAGLLRDYQRGGRALLREDPAGASMLIRNSPAATGPANP